MGVPPFQRFLDDHGPAVHGFLVASVGQHEADDCFQDTFIAALRAYPTLEHDGNLRGWVLTIAHRKAIDAHRSRQRRPVPSGSGLERPELAETSGTGGIRGMAPISLEEPAGLDGEPALWKLVDDLPPKQRAAVRYRFVEDLGYGEIAARLECSQAAARRNVHEGIKKLREAWA